MALFSKVVATGEKALVTYSSGRTETVVGPKQLWGVGLSVQPYKRVVLHTGGSGTVYDETGNHTHEQGPKVVYIHPQGKFVADEIHQLQPHEAMVVTGVDGKTTIYVGTGYTDATTEDGDLPITRVAQVVVKDGETVHEFKWTGKKGDTEFKEPGSLKFTNLRLQETQTWYAVEARTQDGVMVRLHLMLFLKFTDIASLLKNDDPMGVMFNSVSAALLEKLGQTKFEDFRQNPAGTIEKEANLSSTSTTTMKGDLDKLGVDITHSNLRLWVPTDASVERLMAQQATTTAQQAVESAQHDNRLQKLGYEKEELKKEQANAEERKVLAQSKGELAAAEVTAFIKGLKADTTLGGDAATIRQLVLLTQTAKAAQNGLTLTTESFLPQAKAQV